MEKGLENVQKCQEHLRNTLEKKIDSVEEKIALTVEEKYAVVEQKVEPEILQGLHTSADENKTPEILQEYASEVERLANLAFSDHPATVREVISLQYFVDGLKEGEIQRAIRMADVQDLKSALELKAANEASCRDHHSIREARVTADAPG
ncbi:uncharacterized protein TNCV_2735841 [Trichonephila clavipes]|nr:uncharacterized protein TNCV_2735841 [Trichonephila clavipes]